MDPKDFLNKAPDLLFDLISFFSKRNLELTVVGGIPRDYLLEGIVGHDWDIEVSSSVHAFSVSFWKDLAKDLRPFGQVSNLAYQVIRLKTSDYEFEFSPPRIETFSDDDHHKNFEAEYDLKLAPELCWKRRDLTVNAIGFKLGMKGVEVIDPFEGLRMLREKTLHPCSEQFVKDPVRYLRAHRFALRLNFEFSDTLKKYLSSMPQGFSSFYLFSEMKKSRSPLKFYQRLLKEGCTKLPVSDEKIHSEAFEKSLVHPDNLYSWMMSLELCEIDSQNFCDYFGLSKPLQKKLASFAKVSKELSKIDVDFLKQDFAQVQESHELYVAFSWYYAAQQLASKGETSFINDFIKKLYPEWFYLLTFEPLKDVKHIEPTLRSRYIVWNLCQRI
ncbi:MAG: hypothetical protein WCY48_01945 [Candidatus Caldatribacteriota bacterium]